MQNAIVWKQNCKNYWLKHYVMNFDAVQLDIYSEVSFLPEKNFGKRFDKFFLCPNLNISQNL